MKKMATKGVQRLGGRGGGRVIEDISVKSHTIISDVELHSCQVKG